MRKALTSFPTLLWRAPRQLPGLLAPVLTSITPALDYGNGTASATVMWAAAVAINCTLESYTLRLESYDREEEIDIENNAISHLVTGLTPGNRYTFKLVAHTSLGLCATSDPIESTMPTVPSPPRLGLRLRLTPKLATLHASLLTLLLRTPRSLRRRRRRRRSLLKIRSKWKTKARRQQL